MVELVEKEDGTFMERPFPEQLVIKASRFYIPGVLCSLPARVRWKLLPKADKHTRRSHSRMHGRARIGSTFIQILERYALRLQANGGKIILSGVSQEVWEQLERTETFEMIPEVDVFRVEDIGRIDQKSVYGQQYGWLPNLKLNLLN